MEKSMNNARESAFAPACKLLLMKILVNDENHREQLKQIQEQLDEQDTQILRKLRDIAVADKEVAGLHWTKTRLVVPLHLI